MSATGSSSESATKTEHSVGPRMGEKGFEPVAETLLCNGTDRDSKFVPDQKEKPTSPESHGKDAQTKKLKVDKS